MFNSRKELSAQKFITVLLPSNSDNDAIPSIHFSHEMDTTTPDQRIACYSIDFEGDSRRSLPSAQSYLALPAHQEIGDEMR